MKKRFTKIICVIAGLIAALGITLTAGCSGYYDRKPLAADDGANVVSNGGFAVATDGYVYFINGVESNTADNTFGSPVKGAIYRIAGDKFKAHDYSSAECVVPLVAYSADYDAGLFIYGGYIYYATPSTDKSAAGQVQNDKLVLKRTSLDGSKTVKGGFAEFASTSVKYRFTEIDGTVYLMYVAEKETIFDEGEDKGVTNLHSVKIDKDGKATDTILAYNVESVVFDKTDKTNPRAYYTMKVRDYSRDTDYEYNQIYTVRADATEDKFKDTDFSVIEGWNTDEEKGDVDRYINCGDLVFDGIGKVNVLSGDAATPFNYDPTGATVNELSLTYALSSYEGGSLFYTKSAKLPTSTTNASLYSVKDSEVSAQGWNPVTGNKLHDYIIIDGSAADKYTYVFDAYGGLDKVLIAESDGGIYVNKVEQGKMHGVDDKGSDGYYPIVKSGDCKVLFIDDGYLYYSAGGDSGYNFWRVDPTGAADDYGVMPEEDEYDRFRPVQILDLTGVSDWYKPELIKGQLIFASNTYSSYVTVFDLTVRGGTEVMDNADINALNKKYDSIIKQIDTFGDTEKYDEKIYANVVGALKYAYYTGESANVYLDKLAKECNDEALKADEDADLIYTEETLAEYAKFLAPAADNEWKDYTDKVQVNGKDVYANRRDYYFSLLGEMSEKDAEDYLNAFKSENLKPMPEKVSWYNGLSTVEKVFFVLGMCLIGLGVIAAVVVPVTLTLVRKRRGTNLQRKRRIKVDTTDDKNIDVYSDDN